MSENTHLDKMLDKLIVDPWPTVAKPPTMTLDRAIEVLESRAKGNLSLYSWNDEKAAAALGVEALNRLQDNRLDPEFDHWILLPGETEVAP